MVSRDDLRQLRDTIEQARRTIRTAVQNDRAVIADELLESAVGQIDKMLATPPAAFTSRRGVVRIKG
ncbi:MAG: hypothetical protein ABSH50_02715 [Bryobacteraceae bacterium]|jgi:hypothetical protein